MENTEVKADDVNQQKPITGEVQETQSVENSNVNQNVPYSRFKDVNDQLKEYKLELSKLEQERGERDAKIKAEKGEFKELYETEVQHRKEAEAKAQQHDEYVVARKSQIMAEWSDEDKELYGSMSLDKLERHNDKLNLNKVVKTNVQKAGMSNGKPMNFEDFDSMSTQDKRKNWSDYLKFKQKR
tara:strand:- start:4993 stop:5544 length:552 start_codon:yes stop_codon:yes gene_type:complete